MSDTAKTSGPQNDDQDATVGTDPAGAKTEAAKAPAKTAPKPKPRD